VLVAGLVLQAVAASVGGWAVGGAETISPAWAVVDSSTTGRFRVLWVGADEGRPFSAPGGDPLGVAAAGDASLAWSLTDRSGAQAIDLGRPLAGAGADALSASLQELVGGTTTHGGALLAPFAVRFVVAREGDLPDAAQLRLDAQTDLDRVPATGLVIWANAAVLPPASVLQPDRTDRRVIAVGTLAEVQRFVAPRVRALQPTPAGWEGDTGGGTLAVLSTEFDGAWQLEGSSGDPDRAFGWATSFGVTGTHVAITYGGNLPRVVSIWLLAGLWLGALWVTRKPVRR
jgi:hypothetical protein